MAALFEVGGVNPTVEEQENSVSSKKRATEELSRLLDEPIDGWNTKTLEKMEYFLKEGANPLCSNSDGKTVLQLVTNESVFFKTVSKLFMSHVDSNECNQLSSRNLHRQTYLPSPRHHSQELKTYDAYDAYSDRSSLETCGLFTPATSAKLDHDESGCVVRLYTASSDFKTNTYGLASSASSSSTASYASPACRNITKISKTSKISKTRNNLKSISCGYLTLNHLDANAVSAPSDSNNNNNSNDDEKRDQRRCDLLNFSAYNVDCTSSLVASRQEISDRGGSLLSPVRPVHRVHSKSPPPRLTPSGFGTLAIKTIQPLQRSKSIKRSKRSKRSQRMTSIMTNNDVLKYLNSMGCLASSLLSLDFASGARFDAKYRIPVVSTLSTLSTLSTHDKLKPVLLKNGTKLSMSFVVNKDVQQLTPRSNQLTLSAHDVDNVSHAAGPPTISTDTFTNRFKRLNSLNSLNISNTNTFSSIEPQTDCSNSITSIRSIPSTAPAASLTPVPAVPTTANFDTRGDGGSVSITVTTTKINSELLLDRSDSDLDQKEEEMQSQLEHKLHSFDTDKDDFYNIHGHGHKWNKWSQNGVGIFALFKSGIWNNRIKQLIKDLKKQIKCFIGCMHTISDYWIFYFISNIPFNQLIALHQDGPKTKTYELMRELPNLSARDDICFLNHMIKVGLDKYATRSDTEKVQELVKKTDANHLQSSLMGLMGTKGMDQKRLQGALDVMKQTHLEPNKQTSSRSEVFTKHYFEQLGNKMDDMDEKLQIREYVLFKNSISIKKQKKGRVECTEYFNNNFIHFYQLERQRFQLLCKDSVECLQKVDVWLVFLVLIWVCKFDTLKCVALPEEKLKILHWKKSHPVWMQLCDVMKQYNQNLSLEWFYDTYPRLLRSPCVSEKIRNDLKQEEFVEVLNCEYNFKKFEQCCKCYKLGFLDFLFESPQLSAHLCEFAARNERMRLMFGDLTKLLSCYNMLQLSHSPHSPHSRASGWMKFSVFSAKSCCFSLIDKLKVTVHVCQRPPVDHHLQRMCSIFKNLQQQQTNLQAIEELISIQKDGIIKTRFNAPHPAKKLKSANSANSANSECKVEQQERVSVTEEIANCLKYGHEICCIEYEFNRNLLNDVNGQKWCEEFARSEAQNLRKKVVAVDGDKVPWSSCHAEVFEWELSRSRSRVLIKFGVCGPNKRLCYIEVAKHLKSSFEREDRVWEGVCLYAMILYSKRVYQVFSKVYKYVKKLDLIESDQNVLLWMRQNMKFLKTNEFNYMFCVPANSVLMEKIEDILRGSQGLEELDRREEMKMLYRMFKVCVSLLKGLHGKSWRESDGKGSYFWYEKTVHVLFDKIWGDARVLKENLHLLSKILFEFHGWDVGYAWHVTDFVPEHLRVPEKIAHFRRKRKQWSDDYSNRVFNVRQYRDDGWRIGAVFHEQSDINDKQFDQVRAKLVSIEQMGLEIRRDTHVLQWYKCYENGEIKCDYSIVTPDVADSLRYF